MKIMISSIQELSDPKNLTFAARKNINVISIRDSDPSKEYLEMYKQIDSAGIKNLLVIGFDDLEAEIANYTKPQIVPNKEHIETIIDWVKQRIVDNPTGFIIQCTGGVSRSSAVAILVNIIANPNKDPLSVINPIYHSPNYKVLELGEGILNTNGIEDRTRKLMDENNEEFLANLFNIKEK